MTRFFTTCLATTALTALPALAASDQSAEASQSAEKDMAALCENAFTPADTDKDGKVTKAEAQEQRKAEFAQLDANKNGTIEREEYVTCMGKAQDSAKANAEKMQKDSDSTASWDDVGGSNDSLTREDYAERAAEAWQDNPEEAGKVFTYNAWVENEEHYARAAINRFNRQDADNDGVLTKDEYETLARDMEWSDEAVTARFESLDANGNGEISPQEYAAAGTRAAQPGVMDTDTSESSSDSAEAQTDSVVVPVYVYYVHVI